MKTVKDIRKLICENNSNKIANSRELYLAYAFLRGRKYRSIEKKINEDHPSFGEIGRKGFFATFSRFICVQITGNPYLKDIPEESREKRWTDYNEISAKILIWLMENSNDVEIICNSTEAINSGAEVSTSMPCNG